MASLSPRGLQFLRKSRKFSGYVCPKCASFSTYPTLQSGHNRWSKIKHDKAGVDAKKHVLRSMLSRDIAQASKLYGADPRTNPTLANVLVQAKKAGFPKASQEAAIARGQGQSASGASLESLTIEAIMPPSIAMVIDIETDNKARALQELRHEVKRYGGTVTPTSYLFKRRGRVQFGKDERGLGVDEVLDEAIEAGADDVEVDDDGNLIVWTEPSGTIAAAKSLAESFKLTIESSDILWDPNEDTLVPLDSEGALTSLKNLVNALQEDQSVQGIYVNISQGKVSDETWAELQKIPVHYNMESSTDTKPSTTKLELRTAYGPVFRDVLNVPPRDCTSEEIPVIDLTPLYSNSLDDRKKLASQIRRAATNTGFFYIRNHGISEDVIAKAKKQLLTFFKQSEEDKGIVAREKSKYYNGWRGSRKTNISPSESIDVHESFAFRYEPELDPDYKDPAAVPDEIKPWIRGEQYVWDGTAHLPNFKQDIIEYWGACLTLARKLVQIFALSLDLNEHYFDEKVTYPGADGVLNYYPVATEADRASDAVGLGSHTDLQLFTLLWQDYHVGGLQVLNKEGQWIKAPPIEETIVVNIGDFMMRLCNDLYKSTVHRVYNRAEVERVSMPFFFGLNFNCVEGVIPTCTSPDNPPKYEPMSCGDWCQLRFELEEDEMKKKNALQKLAPSGKVILA
ncbi:hypothetical protein V494_07532 [Pseudogymnoascus sp. VKM F-4513 (FW-928)]|nr:hypothetical protein V494_07532 [Pseudogymnoascus sp. VKM F-4513 (FW-928)]